MKTMMTLTEMAVELERQASHKRDFIADSRRLAINDDGKLVMMLGDGERATFGINGHAHSQIASDLKVPKPFYDRLLNSQPDMLQYTVNELWSREPKRRMVRTMDDKARAFVSDKFSVDYDNIDLARFILPELAAYTGLTFDSIGLTETHFYLKAFYPKIRTEVKVGDVIEAGFVLANSEVGDGSIYAYPMAKTLKCLNGMTFTQYGQRRAHVGKRLSSSEESLEIFSDETRQADARAFFLKVRDAIRNILTLDSFEKIVASLREATEVMIQPGSIEGAVEVVRSNFGHSQETAAGVLHHLIAGGDLSVYGLANAVTRQSQDEKDYEMATKLERDGGRIIELPASSWKEIIKADKPFKRAA